MEISYMVYGLMIYGIWNDGIWYMEWRGVVYGVVVGYHLCKLNFIDNYIYN
jgi:hypothetical protein